MQVYFTIIKLAQENTEFRKIIATHEHSQLVLMSVQLQQEIGYEKHTVDQILYFVQGIAQAVVGDNTFTVHPHDLVIVPAGTYHNFVNIGTEDLKLFTIYAPPEHSEK
jgi:mannose-6-phosphate isomerase-like protein (cupin superfamily)